GGGALVTPAAGGDIGPFAAGGCMPRPSHLLLVLVSILYCLGVAMRADTRAVWVDDLSPIAAADWNPDRAAHLIERAGFGETPEAIARLAAMTPRQAVERLVNFDAIDNSGLK